MRPIHTIAEDVRKNWPKVHPFAKPYLDAMSGLKDFSEYYGLDPADEIVLRFLGNAQSWRGPEARRIKLELRTMLKEWS